jgi:HlyD family secretion protein
MPQQMYREAALERLSSPEQLDRLLQITSPRGWLALIALWALLAAVIVWSILGSVLTKEEGQGILVAGDGLKLVVAPGAGRLTDIMVNVGERIEENQVVALINKHDIVEQLEEAQDKLGDLRSQDESLRAFETQEEMIQKNLAMDETAKLEATIAFANIRLEQLAVYKERIEEQVERGYMIEIDVHRVDEEIESVRAIKQQAELRVEELVAVTTRSKLDRDRAQLKRALAIEELEGRITRLTSRLDLQSKVRSRFAGRVVEVRVAVQTAVAFGEPILVVEPEGATELEAILYVSAVTGKNIKEGDEVQLQPSTVKREEYGSMKGIVRSISDVPTSKSAMLAHLSGDHDLVDKFVSEIGLPLEMHVSLTRSNTYSGYAWTTDLGPPATVSAGTLCSGSVTVDRQTPISLVIPILRRSQHAE